LGFRRRGWGDRGRRRTRLAPHPVEQLAKALRSGVVTDGSGRVGGSFESLEVGGLGSKDCQIVLKRRVFIAVGEEQ
jgi:hypothetical protein